MLRNQLVAFAFFFSAPAVPWIAGVQNASGQAFGAPDIDVQDPTGAGDSASNQPSPQSLLVRQLMGQASRGDLEFASALNRLSRLGRWTEVNQLLSSLNVAEVPVAARAEMARVIGSAEILRIQLEPTVSPQANTSLSALAGALTEQSRSPVLLARATKGLLSDSRDQQLASARTLFAGGNEAISAIAAELTKPHSVRDRELLLGALTRLDETAIEAIRQLALYASADRRTNAIESLSQLDDQTFLPDLLTAAFAIDAGDQERAAAMAALARRGQSVTRQDAVQMLVVMRDAAIENARVQKRDDQTRTRWVVEGPDERVTGIAANEFVQSRREVLDFGNRLRRLGELTPDMQREIFASELEYRLALDDEWGSPQEVASLGSSFDWPLDDSFLIKSLNEATQSGNDFAALGLVRWIEATVTASKPPVWQPNALVRSTDRGESALVQLACHSPSTRIRYEAALLVSRIAGTDQYPGSSHVKRTLAEMSRLEDRPTALLVETRIQVAERLESSIERLGYRVSVVPTVADLLRRIALGGDFRLVVSKMQLADLPPVELVDRVRRMAQGRRLPIVFYGEHSDQLQAMINQGRWTTATLQLESIASVAAFDSINQTTARHQLLSPLASDERRIMRRQAIEQLDSMRSR